MESLIYLAPIAGIVALLFAFFKAAMINKAPIGNETMKEISGNIADGARAFLFAEYKVLIVFAIILFVILGVGINWLTALCFAIGACLSTLAGFFGMTVATKANVRTANAAKEGGMNKALSIAFSGGAVMGLCVVGLGILGLSIILIVISGTNGFSNESVSILTGFSLGASSIALFARVGGGIYTKAADVGADLVGKVEAGIPEDDPRNPAVIADNVGDNVGDVAGMGADLFESYVGALVSTVTLAVAYMVSGKDGFTINHVIFPLVIAAIGVLASVIATFFVRGGDNSDPQKALNFGEYGATIIEIIASFILSNMFFGNLSAFLAILCGLVVGTAIGKVTEMYTSEKYKSVKLIAESSQTGSATNIISGLSVGMTSTAIPILFIVIGVLVAYGFFGMYGIALAAVGMLSTTGMTVAVD
nr:sodium-translocating pyrophosphatase [Lachnospiraceae bacterium]